MSSFCSESFFRKAIYHIIDAQEEVRGSIKPTDSSSIPYPSTSQLLSLTTDQRIDALDTYFVRIALPTDFPNPFEFEPESFPNPLKFQPEPLDHYLERLKNSPENERLQKIPKMERLKMLSPLITTSRIRLAYFVFFQHMMETCAPANAIMPDCFVEALHVYGWHELLDPPRKSNQEEPCTIFRAAQTIAASMFKRKENWRKANEDNVIQKIAIENAITIDKLSESDDECAICRHPLRSTLRNFLPEFLSVLPLKEGITLEVNNHLAQVAKLEEGLKTTDDVLPRLAIKGQIEELDENICNKLSGEWIDPEKYKKFAMQNGVTAFKKRISVTSCGHKFCQDCTIDWLLQKRSDRTERNKKICCPYCRATLHGRELPTRAASGYSETLDSAERLQREITELRQRVIDDEFDYYEPEPDSDGSHHPANDEEIAAMEQNVDANTMGTEAEPVERYRVDARGFLSGGFRTHSYYFNMLRATILSTPGSDRAVQFSSNRPSFAAHHSRHHSHNTETTETVRPQLPNESSIPETRQNRSDVRIIESSDGDVAEVTQRNPRQGNQGLGLFSQSIWDSRPREPLYDRHNPQANDTDSVPIRSRANFIDYQDGLREAVPTNASRSGENSMGYQYAPREAAPTASQNFQYATGRHEGPTNTSPFVENFTGYQFGGPGQLAIPINAPDTPNPPRQAAPSEENFRGYQNTSSVAALTQPPLSGENSNSTAYHYAPGEPVFGNPLVAHCPFFRPRAQSDPPRPPPLLWLLDGEIETAISVPEKQQQSPQLPARFTADNGIIDSSNPVYIPIYNVDWNKLLSMEGSSFDGTILTVNGKKYVKFGEFTFQVE